MHFSTFIWTSQVTVSILFAVYKSTCGLRYVACGGYRKANNSEITSPGYPRSYPNGADCTWRLIAPAGHTIRLTFSNFSLEESDDCVWDYVLVEEKEGDSIGKFCGFAKPPEIRSKNNTLIVMFRSDESRVYAGFKARYQFLPNPIICGGYRTQNNSEIFSPRYPRPYPPNVDCTWRIRAPAGYRIQLTFSSFSLEGYQPSCSYDYVLVDRIKKYCGTGIPSAITSKGDTLTVTFHADRSVSKDGFKAKYEFLPYPKQATDSECIGCRLFPPPPPVCGGYLTQNNSEISSLSRYSPYGSCVWWITAPERHRIQLTFSTFSLKYSNNCSGDYVLVEEMEGDSIGKFCGNVTPPAIISLNNTLMVTLHSDDMRIGDGFRATYKFLPSNPISPRETCGGNLTENDGEISSPGYPRSYPNDAYCTWLITAPEGHIIRLTFSNFSLEESDDCEYHYVLVQETEGDKIGKYCGYVTPPAITSMNNTLMVRFHTDDIDAENWFGATYEFLPDPNRNATFSEANKTIEYGGTNGTTEILTRETEAPRETQEHHESEDYHETEGPHEIQDPHATEAPHGTEDQNETDIPRENVTQQEANATLSHQTESPSNNETLHVINHRFECEKQSSTELPDEKETTYENEVLYETQTSHETGVSTQSATLHETEMPHTTDERFDTEIPHVIDTSPQTETPSRTETTVVTDTSELTKLPVENETSRETETLSGTDASNFTKIKLETEAPHDTETSSETDATNETGAEHMTKLPLETETSYETDRVNIPPVTEVPYESEVQNQTNALAETVPEKTETPSETETSHDSDAPFKTDTQRLTTPSHAIEHPSLMNETSRVIERDPSEGDKTVEILFGIFIGLIIVITVVGIYIYKQHSRRKTTDISLRDSVYLQRTEDALIYESRPHKGSITLPM